jgi:2-hydroxychromene-2-carboxylate isomerase
MLEFWYDFASTYSYPAAMRIERLAEAADVRVEWRAFLLGPIFARQGWNDSPFNLFPEKGKYMWKDLARICASDGLPLSLPPRRFPQNSLLAARISLAVASESWLPNFTRAIYAANFAEQRDIADEETIRKILESLQIDPAPLIKAAKTTEIKAALKEQTERAVARGIFGAPSFIVDGELFWGNDRLEAALDAARSRNSKSG